MSEETDYLFALEMQKRWNADQTDYDINVNESTNKFARKNEHVFKRSNPRSNQDEEFLNRTQNLVHPQWESLDPTPDVNSLFQAFDDKFFQGRLKCVSLEWSKRMYSCAGICYSRSNRLGMSITIRLSEPLLKLRTRKDLVETLLHEMIHAYCSVLGIREGNGGHGPHFKKIMIGINKVAGTNITVYHTFYDEVKVYKTHWWRCNGSCQHRSPFFGYVKRTSNRAPGPNDQWWEMHYTSCGGTFMKIKEPEKKTKNKENSTSTNAKPQLADDLRKYFPTSHSSDRQKGPVKTNDGGILNSKKQEPSASLHPSLPPTIIPDTIKNSHTPNGKPSKIIGLKDLEESICTTEGKKYSGYSMSGTAYSLTSPSSSNLISKPNNEQNIERERVREVWSKRFSEKSPEVTSQCESTQNLSANNVDAKRRRISKDDSSSSTADKSGKSSWVSIDDDIMFQDQPEETIDISSDDECETIPSPTLKPSQTTEERKNAIKKEIIDEPLGDENLSDSDIIIIDDDYNDDEDLLNASVELADTSLIDDLFGEDTLLKEFKLENDVIAFNSRRNLSNPLDDIITCPICQGKMKREEFADHLDGCTGIAKKVLLPKQGAALQRLAATSRVVGPRKTKKISRKDVLRKAGYSEQEISSINSGSSDETNSTRSLSGQLQRQRGLHTQTRPCPVCFREVDENGINEHLDECLS